MKPAPATPAYPPNHAFSKALLLAAIRPIGDGLSDAPPQRLTEGTHAGSWAGPGGLPVSYSLSRLLAWAFLIAPRFPAVFSAGRREAG